MINRIIRYSIIFILLLLLQVLLFNNVQFSGYVNPYVYVMFILLIPVDIAPWLLLIISFFTGFIIDIFTSSPGMHTSATVLSGFARPYILRLISPRDGYETNSEPSMFFYGIRWYLIYALLVVFIHHLALFFIEVFRFTEFFRTFLRVLLSTGFSTAFILLLEFIRRGK